MALFDSEYEPLDTPDDAFSESIGSIETWVQTYIWISYPQRFAPKFDGLGAWTKYNDQREWHRQRVVRALAALKVLVPAAHTLIEPIAADFFVREDEMYRFVEANRGDQAALTSRYREFIGVASRINEQLDELLDRRTEFLPTNDSSDA